MGSGVYPRTLHLPWSPGRTDDDLAREHCERFDGRDVVILEKADGEQTTLTHDAIFTRSGRYRRHPSRSQMLALHAAIRTDIPENLHICGENVYARHSIAYDRLPAYFLAFGIFDRDTGIALAWDDVCTWAALLDIATVPVLWRGRWNEAFVRAGSFWTPMLGPESEGYIVRLTDSFPTSTFATAVAKYVHANHVRTDTHWLRQRVVPNTIATS